MHPGTRGLQRIHRPIPTTDGLHTTSGSGPALANSNPRGHGIIVHAHRVQLLTIRGHPHDHTAPPVQVNSHVLPTVVVCAHKGLLRRRSEHPETASGHHGERGPARRFIAARGPKHLAPHRSSQTSWSG